MRNTVLPAISICLVVFSFPQYICLDLISTLFGSYSFSLFPASCLNACLSVGLSLWLWASLAFLTLRISPQGQPVWMDYYYFTNDTHYFPVFLGIYFGVLLDTETSVVSLCRHFHLSHPAILMEKRYPTDCPVGHTLWKDQTTLDLKLQKTCLGHYLWQKERGVVKKKKKDEKISAWNYLIFFLRDSINGVFQWW